MLPLRKARRPPFKRWMKESKPNYGTKTFTSHWGVGYPPLGVMLVVYDPRRLAASKSSFQILHLEGYVEMSLSDNVAILTASMTEAIGRPACWNCICARLSLTSIFISDPPN